MSLHIRAIDIRISTDEGLFGTFLLFDKGLVVLRADNTSGKSTCMNAIIYALGLETALGINRKAPFPPVIYKVLEHDGKEFKVLESKVILEIENSKDEIICCERSIVGEVDTKLIRVWKGPHLTSPDKSYETIDMYIQLAGAATNPKGFHTWFAKYIEWDLPIITKFDGSECPLYLEVIFPLFFVEQRRGWAAIQANLPTFLGIRDASKRAIEYVLGMEKYKLDLERQKLTFQQREIRSQWHNQVRFCEQIAFNLGGKTNGIPASPTIDYDWDMAPQLSLPYEGEFELLNKVIAKIKSMINDFKPEEIPDAGEVQDEARQELKGQNESLVELETEANEIVTILRTEEDNLRSIQQRLRALKEDLRQYQDLAKIERLGGTSNTSIYSGHCPTCGQGVSDALLPHIEKKRPMTVEDNIDLIKGQITLFERLETNANSNFSTKKRSMQKMRDEISTIQNKIVSLKETLISSTSRKAPHKIREQIDLEIKLHKYSDTSDKFDSCISDFFQLSEQWRDVTERLNNLPVTGFDNEANKKIKRLQEIMIEQEQQYGFSSFSPKGLTISLESLKPAREGFDIGFDTSASDNIRLIWGYLLSLLELQRDFTSVNHLGLLILDEPRQQEARQLSFAELIKRASNSKKYNQQVIFSTSEEIDTLKKAVSDTECKFIIIDGKIMKKRE